MKTKKGNKLMGKKKMKDPKTVKKRVRNYSSKQTKRKRNRGIKRVILHIKKKLKGERSCSSQFCQSTLEAIERCTGTSWLRTFTRYKRFCYSWNYNYKKRLKLHVEDTTTISTAHIIYQTQHKQTTERSPD